jgi:hypothetical protein
MNYSLARKVVEKFGYLSIFMHKGSRFEKCLFHIARLLCAHIVVIKINRLVLIIFILLFLILDDLSTLRKKAVRNFEYSIMEYTIFSVANSTLS